MIYLDFNATTPVSESVFAAMAPWFTEAFGNPSSSHVPGRRAAKAVSRAREEVAALLGCEPARVVFTSGATEANNLALKGTIAVEHVDRHRVLVTAVEHKSIIETAASLQHDVSVEVIPVDSTGKVDLEVLRAQLEGGPSVVSVLAANNEVGTLNPIAEISAAVHSAGALFHTDATQWVGKLPVDVDEWDVDLLSMSAHKLYGPKGVGALYVRRGVAVRPLLNGGGQERGVRGGTVNVPAVVGFGEACKLASELLDSEAPKTRALRDRLLKSLRTQVSDVSVNGDLEHCLPNTLNVRFAGAEADAVLAGLPDLAAATGSACTSAVPTPSHVLQAMGLDPVAADESIRLSLGRSTSEAEVDRAAAMLASGVERVRASSTTETFGAERRNQ